MYLSLVGLQGGRYLKWFLCLWDVPVGMYTGIKSCNLVDPATLGSSYWCSVTGGGFECQIVSSQVHGHLWGQASIDATAGPMESKGKMKIGGSLFKFWNFQDGFSRALNQGGRHWSHILEVTGGTFLNRLAKVLKQKQGKFVSQSTAEAEEGERNN